ncbi:MAG: hypothetical protein AAF581_21185 [Planctomycetota bacterium]
MTAPHSSRGRASGYRQRQLLVGFQLRSQRYLDQRHNDQDVAITLDGTDV